MEYDEENEPPLLEGDLMVEYDLLLDLGIDLELIK